MLHASRRLLDACNAARRQGADFPTIWWQIIEPEPMVAGLPIQQMDGGQPVLDIRFALGSGSASAGTVSS